VIGKDPQIRGGDFTGGSRQERVAGHIANEARNRPDHRRPVIEDRGFNQIGLRRTAPLSDCPQVSRQPEQSVNLSCGSGAIEPPIIRDNEHFNPQMQRD
jgi:hypothetical protein